MRLAATLLATSLLAAPALADPVPYDLDASHSQIIFSYNHLGFSTTYGMFSGFEGEIMFDEENPGNSTVSVEFPVSMMFTGWEERDSHFLSADFFNAVESGQPIDARDVVTFESTSIEVTGENTANITGNLTMNDVTQEVVLETTLNNQGMHPQQNRPWLGFDATTTVLRSDFNVGAFAPFVSDEVEIQISIEAGEAESA